MKEVFAVLLFACSTAGHAQEGKIRPYTPAELARWTSICEALSKATVPSYKDYTVTKTACGKFLQFEKDYTNGSGGAPLTVTNLKNEPTGMLPYFEINYTMTEDEADQRQKKIDEGMLEVKKDDGTLDMEKMKLLGVKGEKLSQCKNLRVYISINQSPKLPLKIQFDNRRKPEKLAIPGAFAFLYTSGDDKELSNEHDEFDVDTYTMYQDKAVIVFSNVLPAVTNTAGSAAGTLGEQQITMKDNAPETSMSTVKNVVMKITGFEGDIRALIGAMNWGALKSVIGK